MVHLTEVWDSLYNFQVYQVFVILNDYIIVWSYLPIGSNMGLVYLPANCLILVHWTTWSSPKTSHQRWWIWTPPTYPGWTLWTPPGNAYRLGLLLILGSKFSKFAACRDLPKPLFFGGNFLFCGTGILKCPLFCWHLRHFVAILAIHCIHFLLVPKGNWLRPYGSNSTGVLVAVFDLQTPEADWCHEWLDLDWEKYVNCTHFQMRDLHRFM